MIYVCGAGNLKIERIIRIAMAIFLRVKSTQMDFSVIEVFIHVEIYYVCIRSTGIMAESKV